MGLAINSLREASLGWGAALEGSHGHMGIILQPEPKSDSQAAIPWLAGVRHRVSSFESVRLSNRVLPEFAVDHGYRTAPSNIIAEPLRGAGRCLCTALPRDIHQISVRPRARNRRLWEKFLCGDVDMLATGPAKVHRAFIGRTSAVRQNIRRPFLRDLVRIFLAVAFIMAAEPGVMAMPVGQSMTMANHSMTGHAVSASDCMMHQGSESVPTDCIGVCAGAFSCYGVSVLATPSLASPRTMGGQIRVQQHDVFAVGVAHPPENPPPIA
jgi:hypothetical protein